MRALASLFTCRLHLICGPGDPEIYYSDLTLRNSYELQATYTPYGHLFDAPRLADRVGACDLLISLNPWHTDSVDQLLRLMPTTETIGFNPPFRHVVPYLRQKHDVDAAFDVPLLLDPSLRLADFSGPPRFPSDSLAFARHIRAAFPSGLRVLAVQAETLPQKMWPVERFKTVLDAFLGRHSEFVAWIVGRHDLGLNRGRHGNRVHTFRLPLPAAMALVQLADVFLGVDSCMLHVADLSRVPAVGLFGPSSCQRFGVRFAPHRHVDARGPIEQIDEASVLTALESLVAEALPVSPA
jgi:hypothetical protein